MAIPLALHGSPRTFVGPTRDPRDPPTLLFYFASHRYGDEQGYARHLQQQQLQALDAACRLLTSVYPLLVRDLGTDRVQFLHPTLLDFMWGRLLMLTAGDARCTFLQRVDRTATALVLPGRRVQAKPGALRFLVDSWHKPGAGSPGSRVDRVRKCLFALVAASARGTGVDGGASANAATILNWMGEPMVRQAWDGVVLEGADLTRAVLCGTSLKGASLADCRLDKAVLRDVDLREADLTGIEFGERAPLRLTLSNDSYLRGGLACVGPGLVAVADGGQVVVWDLVTRQRVGWPLVVGSASVVCLSSIKLSGQSVLVCGCDDGAVSLFELKTGNCWSGLWAMDNLTCVAAGTRTEPALLVATGSGNASDGIRLWNGITGQAVGPLLEGASGRVAAVAVGTVVGSGTEVTFMACGGDGRDVDLWMWGPTPTDLVSFTLRTPCAVTCIALCDLAVDDVVCMFLVYGTVSGSVLVWNVSTSPHCLIKDWAAHGNRVSSVALYNGTQSALEMGLAGVCGGGGRGRGGLLHHTLLFPSVFCVCYPSSSP